MEPLIFSRLRTGCPNPKQRAFFEANARHIAYGGARGGGKSWAMRRKFVMLAMRYPKLKLLLLRRTMPELRENHIIPLLEELTGYAQYKDKESVFLFPNGSRLKLGYCAAENDVYQFQGQEYDVIGLEEATHFTAEQREFITTCNRTTRTDFTPRMYYTGNPGNVGHEWFKRLFISQEYKEAERAEDYIFIPAKIYDNKPLIDANPEYLDNLRNLPEDMRRAHLDGDWDALAGQYFKEFRRDIHVIEPFDIPADWRRYVALDYGLDMLACYFIAIDMGGRAYVYKEIYESGLIISLAAERIKERATETIHSYLAPPDLWGRSRDTGKTQAELFYDCGIPLTKVSANRVDGWLNLKEWMRVRTGEDGEKTADLKIFANCLNLIRTLPAMQYDKRNPSDCATEPHEITHAPDALRYALAGRMAPNAIRKPEKQYNFEFEKPKPNPLGKGVRIEVI